MAKSEKIPQHKAMAMDKKCAQECKTPRKSEDKGYMCGGSVKHKKSK